MGKKSLGLVAGAVLLTLTMVAVPALAQLGQSVLSPVRCGTKIIQVGLSTD